MVQFQAGERVIVSMGELPAVREILRDALQLGARADAFDENTPLLGHVPELDSIAVMHVLTAIEQHYGIRIVDDEVSADAFDTVGALVRFVESCLA